jgi:hypothetical protein
VNENCAEISENTFVSGGVLVLNFIGSVNSYFMISFLIVEIFFKLFIIFKT